MYQIDDLTASPTLPALPTDNIGAPGYFTGGAPGIKPPTRVRFWWLNMIQEELRAICTAAGVGLVKSANNQVLTALTLLFQRQCVGTSIASLGWLRIPLPFITIVLQWGSGITAPSGYSSQLFAVSFPTACAGCVVGTTGSTGFTQVVVTGGVPNQNGIGIFANSLVNPGSSGGQAAYSFIALGYGP